MDQDTMLIIIGDHGVTENGAHGSSSPNETQSVLIAAIKGDNKEFYK
jgi:hypothetical protein